MLSLSITLFVGFLMLFLGGVVLVHDLRNRANQLLALFVVFSVAWITFNFLENLSSLPQSARIFFLHADFASAILGAGSILLFVTEFIRRDTQFYRLALYFTPALILAGVSFTSLLLKRIYFNALNDIQFTEGIGFFLYAPAIIVYFIVPCIMLVHEARRAPKEQSAQMQPVVIGLIASMAITLTVNLFLQDVLSVAWFRIGIYALLFFVIGVAWSIVKHEFLHIRFVVIELLFLGILTTLLARTILSNGIGDIVINLGSFVILLILGFSMVRSFLREAQQRLELQKLATDLEVTNKRLRELDELKTMMVSIASHQMRGPLGGIRGYLTMFKEGDLGPLTPKQKDIVSLNLNVLSRLLNAVETFLDITKLQSGKMLLMPSVVDIDEIITGITREFEVPMQTRGLAFSYVCTAPKPVWVKIDPQKLEHVVFNLIDNAHKYTETGSVSVGLKSDGKEAIISVSDTGMGIAPADIPRLFGKFERGSLVVDSGGSGLGLYVVKMLTEMQGGRVWASSPGVKRGTTFYVALPLVSKP